jgi:hypothetical protein
MGQTKGPPSSQRELAAEEGWIHLPARSLAQLGIASIKRPEASGLPA